MKSYEALREGIDKINQNRGHNYCAEQQGKCCSFMIPLTKKDENLIEKAMRQNLIPVNDLEMAVERASSMTESRCVFLTDKGCGIPNYRPLICGAWNEDSQLYACDGCKISSLKNHRVVSAEDSKLVQEAVNYVDGETNGFLPTFVRMTFKKMKSE